MEMNHLHFGNIIATNIISPVDLHLVHAYMPYRPW